MKRIMILCCIAATTMCLNAETMSVTLNKLYCDSMNFELPDKSIEKKMAFLKPASEKYDFTRRLIDTFKKIAGQDSENTVFTVDLRYGGVGIYIAIESQDILDLNDAHFLGDILIDRKHFVILENEENKELLKTYFKKVKGQNVVFERTFEKVNTMVYNEPTHYKAIYNERQRTVKVNEYIINSYDRLKTNNPQTIKEEPEQNNDDSDAFKIDVELFNE